MKLAKDLESTVTVDLDRIQEIAPECSEFTDNIRINLAGQISSMVALIEERGRSNEIGLNLSNKFHFVGPEQRQNVGEINQTSLHERRNGIIFLLKYFISYFKKI